MTELLAGLPSAQLLARVRELVERGNSLEAVLLAHLGEVDARRLYLDEGCSSMFMYCLRVLRFAEGVAYKRIQAARAARRHPELLDAVRRGDLHLTAVGLLAPKLTDNNCADLIQAARHRSADEVRQLLADRDPRPAQPTAVRAITKSAKPPDPSPALPQVALALPEAPQPSSATGKPPVLPPEPRDNAVEKGATKPLGAERYRVAFMTDRETYAQLEELRALMRHQVPDGDVGKILARAVTVLLAQVRKQKFAETSRPRAARPARSPNELPSRHIPAAIRRAVSQRDGGCCTYVSSGGRRCGSREFLEFDHAEAWTWTRTHTIEGITLRCRAHNQQRARLDFGESHMARFRKRDANQDALPATPVRQLDSNPAPGGG